jgi:hypothetical protein
MSSLSFKNIFHDPDFSHRIDEAIFIILSFLILIPLVFFCYGMFCLIMCFVQNIFAG